mmetsp:Transcript_60567/g.108018  ORF Transcript_60567/g.108018 Transcript_60567/m.108018 type:complete len:202 (+) Transcript_60567:164-769(+)
MSDIVEMEQRYLCTMSCLTFRRLVLSSFVPSTAMGTLKPMWLISSASHHCSPSKDIGSVRLNISTARYTSSKQALPNGADRAAPRESCRLTVRCTGVSAASPGNVSESCPEPAHPQLWVPLSCCSFMVHGLERAAWSRQDLMKVVFPTPASPRIRIRGTTYAGVWATGCSRFGCFEPLALTEVSFGSAAAMGPHLLVTRGT